MGLAEFAKVRCGGPAIAVSLAVALAASLTLAPALLRILGPIAFWPCAMPAPGPRLSAASREGLWGKISHHVVARPGLIWAMAVLVLLPLAVVGLGVRPNYRATAELAPKSDSVKGLIAIRRHFTPGEVGPITVLLESTTDWEGPRGHRHSLAPQPRLRPAGQRRRGPQPDAAAGQSRDHAVAAGRHEPQEHALQYRVEQCRPGRGRADQPHRHRSYVARIPSREVAGGGWQVAGEGERPPPDTRHPPPALWRLDVVPHSDPFAPQSIETLELIQLWLRAIAAISGGGERAGRVSRYHRQRPRPGSRHRKRSSGINTLVLAGIFLILLVLVRRPWLAVYLLATPALSSSVSVVLRSDRTATLAALAVSSPGR